MKEAVCFYILAVLVILVQFQDLIMREDFSGEAWHSFRVNGVQGPIRGMLKIENKKLADVRFQNFNEGMYSTSNLKRELELRFIGRTVERPIVIDAITGATITTHRAMEAINKAVVEPRTKKQEGQQ